MVMIVQPSPAHATAHHAAKPAATAARSPLKNHGIDARTEG
jgi:hypothetical protein